MRDTRPINRNPLSIRLPVTAIVSILHRISGFSLFLLIPVILCLVQTSLTSSVGFLKVMELLQHPGMKLLLFLFLAAFLYHLLAGVRHLFMDAGYGDSKSAGRATAFLVLIISIGLAVWVGARLWHFI